MKLKVSGKVTAIIEKIPAQVMGPFKPDMVVESVGMVLKQA